NFGRQDFAAATGKDGRIYAIGGWIGGDYPVTSEAEVYTPASNKWASIPPMPTARQSLAAATRSDGRIYAIGGFLGGATERSAVVEVYTPCSPQRRAVERRRACRIGSGNRDGYSQSR